jgi:restriction endonuclease S subunit
MSEFKRVFTYPDEWPRIELAELCDRVARRNAVGNDNVLTISAQRGLVKQEHYFNKRVASKNLSSYYLLEKGDFAYNKSYSKGYPFGVISKLKEYSDGVVSPLYICFRIASPSCKRDYLYYLFTAGALDEGLSLIAKEGVRAHGLINVGVNDFFQLTVCLPSNSEQEKIAEVLSTVDSAIDRTEALIAKEQRIKTGLMQDLLTRGIDERGNLRSESTHAFKDSPLGRIPVEWGVKPAIELCNAVLDCKNRTPPAAAAGHPVIRTPNVRDGEFVFTDLAFTDPRSYAIWIARGKPHAGDVVITREAPFGEACQIPDDLPNPCLGQRMMMYQANPEKLRSDYLVYALYSERVQSRLLELAGGSTVGHIRVGDIRRLPIPHPIDIREQARIAAHLTASRTLLKQLRADRKKLGSLKVSLMYDLLTGKKLVTSLLELALTH